MKITRTKNDFKRAVAATERLLEMLKKFESSIVSTEIGITVSTRTDEENGEHIERYVLLEFANQTISAYNIIWQEEKGGTV